MINKIQPTLRIISLILLFFILTSSFSAYSLEASENDQPDVAEITYKVNWLKTFQSSDAYNTDKHFTQRIIDFIIGSENTGLIRPYAVYKTGDNKIWILDQGLHAIVKVEPDLTEMEIIPYYPSPIAICRDNFGTIYFTDSKENAIYTILDDEPDPVKFNLSIKLNRPTGIAYAKKTRQLWVVETGEHHISIFDRSGNRIRTVGRRGNGSAEFNFPTFITIDTNGQVYVVDTMNFRVQIYDPFGNYIGEFGSLGDSPGYFAKPKGIATDSRGHIYVVESLLNAVQVFNSNGDFLYIFGGYGKEKNNFWMPAGIHIDSNDHIYLADSFNSSLHIFELVTNNE